MVHWIWIGSLEDRVEHFGRNQLIKQWMEGIKKQSRLINCKMEENDELNQNEQINRESVAVK